MTVSDNDKILINFFRVNIMVLGNCWPNFITEDGRRILEE